MMKRDVRSTGDALAYLVDCTLATVCDLAGKKSRSNCELDRQIEIAQSGYDWMIQMGVKSETTRADEVRRLFNGSVREWAKKYDVLKRL